MGFSSDDPKSVGNMMHSYLAQKNPLLGGIVNSLSGSKDPYGKSADGSPSVGFFNPNFANGIAPNAVSPSGPANPTAPSSSSPIQVSAPQDVSGSALNTGMSLPDYSSILSSGMSQSQGQPLKSSGLLDKFLFGV